MLTKTITKIRKRSDDIAKFDQAKITKAITKALKATGQDDEKLAKKLSDAAIKAIGKKFHERSIPAVEEIQDAVEEALISERQIQAAKALKLQTLKV